ncbi:MAG TPA: DUF998 domain-containing protein [Vicinamibacterales bacterium]|nr:DUF998 domain-containing protein [Vicinamibacterales bacterium]
MNARPTDHDPTTSTLLTLGAAAGPLYVIAGVAQILTREGFDWTRHALSLMSNGPRGWVQVANFLLSGLLVLAGAAGLKRALVTGRGRTAGPVLIAIYGLGLVGAAFFSADPALGFPPGTPDGPPAVITTHGLLHFVCGGIGFFGLIAACLVLAARFRGTGHASWMMFSLATGVLFFAAFAGIASGAPSRTVVVAFYLAVLLAWTWLSALFRSAPVRTQG